MLPIVHAHQPADVVATSRNAAGGIGVADAAIDTAHQPADDVATSRNAAGGIGVVDDAHQPVDSRGH
jgi:hypothetical protein